MGSFRVGIVDLEVFSAIPSTSTAAILLWDDSNGSAPRLLTRPHDAHRTRLLSASKNGAGRNLRYRPVPAVHGVVRWRLIALAPWLFEEFRLVVSK
jgi:hypothetical protein